MSFTKQDITTLREVIKEETKPRFDGMESRIIGSIRDLNINFVKSQGLQNDRMDRMDKRFDTIDVKLDRLSEDMNKVKLAVVDLLGTDRHMHNLVRELGKNGMPLDESKIFLS